MPRSLSIVAGDQRGVAERTAGDRVTSELNQGGCSIEIAAVNGARHGDDSKARLDSAKQLE
jgi:hypothetical protein